MAKAADSLRQMVQNEVLPFHRWISTGAAATRVVARPDNPKLVAVRQDLAGAFTGRALLILPERSSLELVRAVAGSELPLEDTVGLEDEALAETGNLIPNSWFATLANLLKSAFKMSLPVVILPTAAATFSRVRPRAWFYFLNIRFEIRQKQTGGYVSLLMDVPSLDELRSLIANYVNSIT